MQHSRIQEKWIRVEQKILEDHLDAGKSAVEFRKWQEALEDPKTENLQNGAEGPFQDLEDRMGMSETGGSGLLLVPIRIVFDDEDVFATRAGVPINPSRCETRHKNISGRIYCYSIRVFI